MVFLHVVVVVSNPAGFQRRYRLFDEFCARMECTPGVKLTSVELQVDGKPFHTTATHKIRAPKDVLWLKENLLNIGVSLLPSDWQYAAWIDADLEFHSPTWVEDTIEQLQNHDVVQLFSHAVDFGPRDEALQVRLGFVYAQFQSPKIPLKDSYYRQNWNGITHHVGYAWALTRKAYEQLGGFIDFGILGSADTYMALSFYGAVQSQLNHRFHPRYIAKIMEFQERARGLTVGYIHCTTNHAFHGCKENRKYVSRWQILIDHQFNPDEDIVYTAEGVMQLAGNKPALEDAIRDYFFQRDEDSDVLYRDYPFRKKHWT